MTAPEKPIANQFHVDADISQDIASLTHRLDAIIREQAGARFFEKLSNIRRFAVTQRKAHWHDLSSVISRLSVAEAYDVVHAFSLFFQLVNHCEEQARLRHLQRNPEPPMSVAKLFAELRAAGVKPADLQRCMDELEIQPVLTAHPTEAKRRTVLDHIQRLNSPEANVDEVLETLWHTEEVRQERVTPIQEVAHAVFFFEHAIFDATTRFYQDFDRALSRHFPTVKRKRAFLTYASWVGGDRDGNPFVTPELSRSAADWYSRVAYAHYEKEASLLVKEITHADKDDHPSTLAEPAAEYQPFERLRARMAALRGQLRARTADIAKVRRELLAIRTDLLSRNAHRAANARIANLILQMEIFGPHLAELDFRDHSERLATAELDVLSELDAIASIQRMHGKADANHFILSMTNGPEVILRLLELVKRAGLKDIDLVPLFETIEDLEASTTILEAMWADKAYRKHLARRGDIQEVMVGYSDSNKDGGYLAANWHLYKAQKAMALSAAKAGIKLRFFHGKGGTIDRGGGASHRSLRAQPHAAVGGRIRITEQGEVVSLKYSHAAIAQRNLEQLTSAVIAAACLPQPEEIESRLQEWEPAINRISELATAHYRDLVYETPTFVEYFWEATPIDLIEHLRLGSRPTRRQTTRDLRQLRAIPWVFAWTQSRHMLSAWFGLGHGFAAFIAETPDGEAKLQEMYVKWPFFRTLIDNAEMSLAKADLDIARRYAALVRSTSVRNEIFGRIEAGYEMAIKQILLITGRSKLLEKQPVLAQSLLLRNPYVDPLHHIQIRFLKLWREAKPNARTEDLRRLLALTVNGIAFGMKSTG